MSKRINYGPQQEREANRITVSRGVGLPRQFRTKLRLASNNVVNVTGTINSQAYGCNTPNNVCRTVSTGETPGYYAKLAALYDRCYVSHSQIRLEVVNVTVGDGVQITLSNDGNTNVPTNIFELMERTGAQSHMLGHYSGGDASALLRHDWLPLPFIGVPANSPDNTVVGADPPNPYFWILSMISTGGGTGNVAVQVIVELDVTFHELTLPY